MGSSPTLETKVHLINWDDAKVSRLWDYYSHTSPYRELYFSKRFGRKILCESKLPLHEELNVLDFGCGPGYIWDHLRELDAKWTITGVDFSEQSVASLASRTKQDLHVAKVQHITKLPTPLATESFDVVLLLEVVEHLKDQYLDGTISEVCRLLKKGGVVLITTPNEEDLKHETLFCPECGAVYHKWQHVRSWSVQTLEEYLGQYGLILRRRRTVNFEVYGWRATIKEFVKRFFGRKSRQPHMVAVFTLG